MARWHQKARCAPADEAQVAGWLAASAGATGATPIDMDLSRNSTFLYALNAGSHNLSAFQMRGNGSLISLGTFGSLPPGAVGVAAS